MPTAFLKVSASVTHTDRGGHKAVATVLKREEKRNEEKKKGYLHRSRLGSTALQTD